MAVTWNPSDKASSITLSNGNLTAAKTGTTGYAIARATHGRTTGKWVFAIDPGPLSTTDGDVAVGIASSAESLTTWLGSSLTGQSLGYYGADTAYRNGASQGGGGLWGASASEVMVAVDLDANLVWSRVGNGLWNDTSGANPATGVGGWDISALTGRVYPACMVKTSGDTITGNFTGPFINTAPSGFAAWDDGSAAAPNPPPGYIFPSWVDPVTISHSQPIAWGYDPSGDGQYASVWAGTARETWSWYSPDDNQIDIEVRSGDLYDEPNWTDPPTSERSEIGHNVIYPFGTALVYEWETRLTGPTNTSPWVALHQNFSVGASGSPPFGIYLESGAGTDALRIMTRSGTPASPVEVYRYTQVNFARNAWHKFRVESKAHPTGSGSYLRVWLNNVKIIDLTGLAMGYSGQTGHQMYWGIYRYEAPETLVHSVRNMRLGLSGTLGQSSSTLAGSSGMTGAIANGSTGEAAGTIAGTSSMSGAATGLRDASAALAGTGAMTGAAGIATTDPTSGILPGASAMTGAGEAIAAASGTLAGASALTGTTPGNPGTSGDRARGGGGGGGPVSKERDRAEREYREKQRRRERAIERTIEAAFDGKKPKAAKKKGRAAPAAADTAVQPAETANPFEALMALLTAPDPPPALILPGRLPIRQFDPEDDTDVVALLL